MMEYFAKFVPLALVVLIGLVALHEAENPREEQEVEDNDNEKT